MERQEVTRQLYIDFSDLDGLTREQILLYFTDLQLPQQAAKIDVDYDCNSAYFRWTELETDTELAWRIKVAAQAEAAQRQHYERLKAKFEGK